MLKKICSLSVLSLIAISSFLCAEYDIDDIGTLQTHSSQPIAINNQGQILGWYNIDGSATGKHFFVREKKGSFHELPLRENGVGWEINWRYLTNNGKAYGTFDGNANFSVLYAWDQKNGVVKLGNLPGKDIVKINDAGQVLIRSIKETEDGRTVIHPIIWKDGIITRLKGLEGDLGIEAEESYGYDMNNRGEVIGQSVAYLVYKNELYKEKHATKWVNGKAIDIHNKVTKRPESIATAINDLGEILIEGMMIHEDGKLVNIGRGIHVKTTDTKYLYYHSGVFDKFGKELISPGTIVGRISHDLNSIWMGCGEIICVNDIGEAIATGKTIYGEQHIMFLRPVSSK